MKNPYVLDLCHSAPSIAAELAKHPTHSVDRVVRRMRKRWRAESIKKNFTPVAERDRLDRAETCGKFPYRPSDLFLNVYADVLDSLCYDPLANLVSPSLVGTSGVVPLSIVSVIPDIMRHCAHLIANAQHEVLLATNYWENSYSSALVCDSLRALSKRGIDERKRDDEKVVVKVIYDRGTASQVVHNHAPVPPEKWGSVGLPRPEDIRGIRMEVVNYHRPPLGTFHAKYLVVDRKIACINSNNVQDRPNVEMCVHLEGPIVDSFYDVALFSWSNKFDPPLPLLTRPPIHGADYRFGDEHDNLRYIDSGFASAASRTPLEDRRESEVQQVKDTVDPGKRKSLCGDGPLVGQAARAAARIPGVDEGVQGKDELFGQHPPKNLPNSTGESNGDVVEGGEIADDSRVEGRAEEMTGNGYASVHTLEERQERPKDSSNPQPDAFMAQSNGSTASPSNYTSLSDSSLGPDVSSSAKSSSSSSRKSSRVEAITHHLNGFRLQVSGTAEEDDSMDDFQPHIMHASHEPVPIAMVNRLPRGTPGHESVCGVPQNVAWLSLLRNAKKSVFIQTPTFNASPVIPGVIDACRRGVEVTLYLDLGFNDMGEMIPFQGGTNEQVVHVMYKVLNKEGKGENLKVYWYTAKDQKEPVAATRKSRNCHIKFMSVDSQVTMVGNGNQDTQSWFHSQEINLLIDSAQLTREWLEGIEANQNTGRFGKVDTKDGVWRAPDGSGRAVQSSGVKKGGAMDMIRGIASAVRRARGIGGF